MKIWIIEIGEPLPLEPNVRMHRYGQFSKALAQMGHDVTWWTSTFSHAPKKHFASEDQQLVIDGVRVNLIHGPGYSRNVSLARIQHNKEFAVRLEQKMRAAPVKPDLIVAPIPVVEHAETAVRFAREHSIPVLTDIRDNWPDELRDLAPKSLRWLSKLLLFRAYKKMRYVCSNATGIMGVAEAQVDFGLAFANRKRSANDHVFPLGYSTTPVEPEKLAAAQEWCKSMGIRSGVFTVCFFGTIGRFFDLSTVIKAAARLEKEMDIQFVLAGDGTSLSRFKAESSGLKSVIFPGWIDAPKISAIMSLSKAGIAPYARDAKMSLPNKPFEYMAGGLPLLSSIQGELTQVLAKHDCGITYTADSVDELCNAIRRLYGDEKRRGEMGVRARVLLESTYSTEVVFKATEKHFRKIAGELLADEGGRAIEIQS